MAINDSAWIMMLQKDRFRDFIADDICDTSKSREVLTCISADSRDGVDALVDAAIAANAALGLMEPMSCGIGGDLFATGKAGHFIGQNDLGRVDLAALQGTQADIQYLAVRRRQRCYANQLKRSPGHRLLRL